MRIISGALNGQYLRALQDGSIGQTEVVRAAIAYAKGDPKLFQDCWINQIPLIFYGRYDRTVPISISILNSFLNRKSPLYVCRLIPDIFHSKVIWWDGYGVYIGSANLTDSAWWGNIEMGVFYSQEELIANNIQKELLTFFERIHELSHPLTDEIYKELCLLERKNRDLERFQKEDNERHEKTRLIPRLAPLTATDQRDSNSIQKSLFLKEWNDTLQILRDIADRVSQDEYRPAWIEQDTPKGAQADQFLHAYYYESVLVGNKATHYDLYSEHCKNPAKPLAMAMDWWKTSGEAPHDEDSNLEGAKIVRQQLAIERIEDLTEDEFVEVCEHVHALRNHCLRVRNATLGLPSDQYTPEDERIVIFSKWLFRQKSDAGHSVLEVIRHVLYGGTREKVPERIWDAISDPHWIIPHLGISTIGEIVGWALPDRFPPRNGRTSKALYALGYPVKIYTE